jgi:hypothetical protein
MVSIFGELATYDKRIIIYYVIADYKIAAYLQSETLLANPKYYDIDTFSVHVLQSTIFLLIATLILPKGSVRDESTFFIMLSILVVLVVMAVFLRRRRLKNDKY